MHLLAEKLTHRGASQMSLFEGPGGRAERVSEVKREINARHGRFAVRSAATLPLAGVYADPANGYDICDVKDNTDSGKEMRDFRSRISDGKFFSRNDWKSEIIDLEYQLNSWTPYKTCF